MILPSCFHLRLSLLPVPWQTSIWSLRISCVTNPLWFNAVQTSCKGDDQPKCLPSPHARCDPRKKKRKERNLAIKNFVFLESDTLYHIVCTLYFRNVERNRKTGSHVVGHAACNPIPTSGEGRRQQVSGSIGDLVSGEKRWRASKII